MSGTQLGGWSRRQAVVVPVVAVLVAALAGAVLLWTVKGHQSSTPAIPVAIVNQDQPVTTGSGQDQKTVAAGRLLAANLSQPAPSAQTPLSWQLMDAADASAGVQDGTLYGVLTIPAGFSAAITSTSGSSPQQAQLSLQTDDSQSAAVAALAQLTVDSAARSVGQQVTSGYVSSMLGSFTTIHGNLAGSASSASTLAGSSGDLASSSHGLASSAGQVASGADHLDHSSGSLAQGAASLSSGAASAASGAAQVAHGSTGLVAAAGQLDQGASAAAAGAGALAASSQKVATGASALADQSGDLRDGLAKVDVAAGALADGSAALADSAQRIAADCPTGTDPAYCARVGVLAKASGAQSDAARLVKAGVTVQTARGAAVAAGASALSTAGAGVAGGAADLSTATGQVAGGAHRVSTAAAQLASGAAGVAKGTRSVANGAAQTSSGAASLADGAAQLAGGSAQLASGSTQLAGGADQLASGNSQLATGLSNGAGQVPTYTSDQQNQISTVVTTPVAVGPQADDPTTVAISLVPAVIAVILWLGTLMMFLTRSPVPTGGAWAQASASRRVLRGLRPAVLVGIVQAAILVAVVAVSGVSIDAPLALLGMSVLGAVTFAATNQALVSVFGATGRMVSLAFVALQAAALGGLVPVQTASAALQLLNAVLPVPQLSTAIRPLLLGGGGSVVPGCVVLLLWTVLAVVVSLVAASRRRPSLAEAVPPRSHGVPIPAR